MLDLYVKVLNDQAILPTQSHPYDAGYDLYACDEYTLQPGERHAFMIGLAMLIPQGWYGRISPRSGLAMKHGIDILAGVVDHSYTGEIGVVMVNLGQEPYTVHQGDRIAQYICSPCGEATFHTVDEFPVTSRQEGGFGSSGK